jgi:hypothetical protein
MEIRRKLLKQISHTALLVVVRYFLQDPCSSGKWSEAVDIGWNIIRGSVNFIIIPTQRY